MGMYDYVKCLYPTPWPNAREMEFRSKDTDAQYLDTYEIRADGTLWHEEYDERIEEADDAPFRFGLYRDNPRWVQQAHFTGQLEIYGSGYRIIFWFTDGKVTDAAFYEGEIEVKQSEKREGETNAG